MSWVSSSRIWLGTTTQAPPSRVIFPYLSSHSRFREFVKEREKPASLVFPSFAHIGSMLYIVPYVCIIQHVESISSLHFSSLGCCLNPLRWTAARPDWECWLLRKHVVGVYATVTLRCCRRARNRGSCFCLIDLVLGITRMPWIPRSLCMYTYTNYTFLQRWAFDKYQTIF